MSLLSDMSSANDNNDRLKQVSKNKEYLNPM